MNNKYYKSLQLLRCFAFLAIFFFHSTVLPEAFSRWSITVFLMLSGFLNALHGYEKRLPNDVKSSLKYAIRKIKGIYPLHLIMLLVAVILHVFSTRAEILSDFKNNIITEGLKLITNIFLISDWGPKSGWWYRIFSEYNIVTWYLSLSLILFLLTPLFIKIMHKLYDGCDNNFLVRPIMAVLIIYVVTIIINVTFVFRFGGQGAFLYIYEHPLSRAGDYLIALQIGYMYVRSEKRIADDNRAKGKIRVYGILVIATLVVLASQIYLSIAMIPPEKSWVVSSGFFFTMPTAVLVYSLGAIEDSFTKKIESNVILERVTNVLIYIGSISQYAYLIHVPVINLIHGVYSRIAEVNLAIWSVIAFIVTMGMSYIVKAKK